MDEEDLADAEEDRRVQTSEDFAGLGSTASERAQKDGLMDNLKAGGETMGVKLLRRMGWRDGQGIGAKVRRKARLGETNDPQSDDKAYLFAPENSAMITLQRKDDQRGLGFERESRLTESTTDTKDPPATTRVDSAKSSSFSLVAATSEKVNRKGTSRGGFGVGILNDNGSDDEDPYQMGPQISYNRVVGGDKKKKKKATGETLAVGSANPLLGSKPVFISKRAMNSKGSTGFRRCHDGRLHLDGFVLSQEMAVPGSVGGGNVKYSAPAIPKDWESAKKPDVTQKTSNYVPNVEAAKSQILDPKARASLLGEALLPGKSVFDFLSPSARDRIVSASGKTDLPAALSESAPKGFSMTEEEKHKELWELVPRIDRDVAIQALGRGVRGWMPYAEDEAKRNRYRAFLELRGGLRENLPERPDGMVKGDWVNELNEFAHAAQIFKPMTGMMATRFTTSNVSPKLASDAPDASSPEQLLDRPSERAEDPAEVAAKVGMYGTMTRSLQQFFPTRLLCKRFNVKPPSHVQLESGQAPDALGGNGFEGGTRSQSAGHQPNSSALPNTKLELVSQKAMETILLESGVRREVTAETGEETEAVLSGKAEVLIDSERNEALESARPGDAVFKAIFGSDDEDDDD
jgi:G patch domain-containing protein 1